MERAGKNARFGSRYGRRVRKRILTVEAKYKGKTQTCPFCNTKFAERKSAGIFYCKNCKKKFAGGAYEPTTLVKRMLNKVYDKKGKAVNKQIDIKEIEKLVEDIKQKEETQEE